MIKDFLRKTKLVKLRENGKMKSNFIIDKSLKNALNQIDFTKDTDKKSKEKFKNAFLNEVKDNERLKNIISLMNNTKCKLRIIPSK